MLYLSCMRTQTHKLNNAVKIIEAKNMSLGLQNKTITFILYFATKIYFFFEIIFYNILNCVFDQIKYMKKKLNRVHKYALAFYKMVLPLRYSYFYENLFNANIFIHYF